MRILGIVFERMCDFGVVWGGRQVKAILAPATRGETEKENLSAVKAHFGAFDSTSKNLCFSLWEAYLNDRKNSEENMINISINIIALIQ